MKIFSVQSVYYQKFGIVKYKPDKNLTNPINSVEKNIYPQITFGLANAGKLKKLFSHGLPCMYSGIEMIDPKKVQRMMNTGVYKQPLKDLINTLKPFENSIIDIEGQIYKLLKEKAIISPDLTLQEAFIELSHIYKKRLRKKQAPIFEELVEVAQKLPEKFKYKFKLFMQETEDKLNDKPVYVPFSKTEFKYKLEKIKKDVSQHKSPKAAKVVDKLLLETERFEDKTHLRNIKKQKEIISFMDLILKHSVLKNNSALLKLLEDSMTKLNLQKLSISFSRKSFIYDLQKLIEKVPDKNLQDEMIEIARKLPTSQESKSAYIMKYSNQSSEKIFFRLLWPAFASVEHILPQSCGGKDSMKNYGGATTRENTARQNIDFTKQLKRKPEAKINCQKYLNRLIEYAKKGIFAKYNLDINHIEDFKDVIKRESKGSLILDTSELYKK